MSEREATFNLSTRCGECGKFPCDHIVWRTDRLPAKGELLLVDGRYYTISEDAKLTADGLGYTLKLTPNTDPASS